MTIDTATAPVEEAPDDTRGGDPERKFIPLSKAFGWDKGGLVVVSQEVLDRYNVAYLSPSTAKAMDGCPARWAAEKAMPERDDPFGAADLGTSAHGVLEDLFQLPGSERTQATAMNILRKHSLEQWPGHDEQTLAQRTRWVAEVYNAMIGLWDIEDPTTVVVKETEMRADGVEIGGVPFKGFIDRVDYTPDGIKVVDYKSGKVPQNITRFGDDHGDQIRLYAHVLEAMTGEMPHEGYLYYTRHSKGRRVPMNPKVMREVLAKFQKSWKALNTYHSRAEFPTKTSPLCGWCPLVNACPSAQADGKEPRIEGIPTKVDLGIPILRTFEAADLTVAARKQANRRAPAWDLDFGSASDEPPLEDPEAVRLTAPEFDHLPVDPEAPDPAAPKEPSETLAVPDAVVHAERADDPQNDPQAGSAQGAAAHLYDENPTTTEMTDMNDLLAEDKSWIETVNGNLNPNSFAAIGVFATSQLAYEEINKAGMKPTKALIDGLSQTYAFMITQAQVALTGASSWQDGANTRLRGALRSYQEANPLPFGKNRAAWDAWVDLGVKHMKAMASAAVRLWAEDAPESPWSALAVAEPVDEFDENAA